MRVRERSDVRRESFSLSQCFVQNDADSGSQVETTNVWIEHGYYEASFPVSVQQAFGQASRFAAENKAIFIFESPIEIAPLALGAEIDEPR